MAQNTSFQIKSGFELKEFFALFFTLLFLVVLFIMRFKNAEYLENRETAQSFIKEVLAEEILFHNENDRYGELFELGLSVPFEKNQVIIDLKILKDNAGFSIKVSESENYDIFGNRAKGDQTFICRYLNQRTPEIELIYNNN